MAADMSPESPTYELAIPVLNGEKHLSAAVLTLYEYLATLGRDLVTVVIADNGSTDATEVVAPRARAI
jgi:glycosyltransferase involved in cell wall biosynthesis